MVELTKRQRDILRRVVEEYVATREPVGSKALVERSGLAVSASTVRSELAELEALGLLTHPHTSAGRIPTEAGYRFYAEDVLERMETRPARFPLDLSSMRSEIEDALQSTTEMLSQVTRLLALVSAPGFGTASVRHIEVLVLQPTVVMVVTITSSGGVAKKLFTFEQPVDPGLAAWANEYLNERLVGVGLGSHLLRRRIEEESRSSREQGFLDALRPAFLDLATPPGRALYMGGAASLLDDVRADELEACRRLLSVLEQRAAVLELVSESFDVRRPFVKVGLDHPGLHDVALVGATYGLRTRTLGTVGLLGPVRMDYEKAVRTVRAAAFELSRLVESAYDG
ncbi:MAG: heat-inducible transcription repressor HrcA [Actinobacteria bacterium]|nr:heat-inducible transcription repressor HrcA [Actinomycetota bacterium]MDQ3163013.1 heat-inducible transcriptional repressor HrcA [Actinomycetota bacterium]